MGTEKKKNPKIQSQGLLSLKNLAKEVDSEIEGSAEKEEGNASKQCESNNAGNRDSFGNVLKKAAQFKANAGKLKAIYIRDDLKEELEMLKSIADTTTSALLCAIVDEFIENNITVIKEYKSRSKTHRI